MIMENIMEELSAIIKENYETLFNYGNPVTEVNLYYVRNLFKAKVDELYSTSTVVDIKPVEKIIYYQYDLLQKISDYLDKIHSQLASAGADLVVDMNRSLEEVNLIYAEDHKVCNERENLTKRLDVINLMIEDLIRLRVLYTTLEKENN